MGAARRRQLPVRGCVAAAFAVASQHAAAPSGCRLVVDAAGRPALQAELEGVQTRVRELLYLIKQMPDMPAEGSGEEEDDASDPLLP